MEAIKASDWKKRKEHFDAGCWPAMGVRPDARCPWCKDHDARRNLEASLGWNPGTNDRRFLRSLRIDPV